MLKHPTVSGRERAATVGNRISWNTIRSRPHASHIGSVRQAWIDEVGEVDG